MSRMVKAELLFPCAFDVFILIVIHVGLFFFCSSTVSLGPFHRQLHLSGVSLQSSDNIVEMFLRPDLSQG